MARLRRAPCALLLGLALLLPAARPGRSDLSLFQQRPRPRQGPSASPAPGSAFTLKVQVKDVASRLALSGALVEVFVNHTRTRSALTGRLGAALLRVPYTPGLGLTLLARRPGYVLAPLAWRPGRMPIYSSVTLSLFPQSQADIWLFEDTVLITGKPAEAQWQPRVQFPKASLALPASQHAGNVTAYLTVLQQFLRTDGSLYAPGTPLSAAGAESAELAPLAAVCVRVCAGGGELQVAGPAQLSLPLRHTRDVRPGDRVPAWTLDMSTGTWVSHGRGTVQDHHSHLAWTYDAPHLGYWIAAPLPGTRGRAGAGLARDLAAYHTAFLTAILGGTVLLVGGFLAALLCYCRDRCRPPRKRHRTVTRLEALRRDQTTSTTHIPRAGSPRAEDGARSPWPADRERLRPRGEDRTGPAAPSPAPGALGGPPRPQRLLRLHRPPPATLPRPGPRPEPGGREAFTQTLPQGPGLAPAPAARAPPPAPGWGLLESASVPGTLSRAGAAPSPAEPPCPHPRAWFVSLDGKPAAPVRHSFIALRRGRRGHSHGASLDSGVDLQEPPAGCRRDRDRDPARGAAAPRGLGLEDPDLSSSESGTAVGSPEDPALRPAPEPPASQAASPPRKRGRAPLASRDGKAGARSRREERPLLPPN